MVETHESKDVPRQPEAAKTSKTRARSFTRIQDWIIWGFIISVLAHTTYVHLYVPAMTVIQVPKPVTCPVHERDPMEQGLLPTRYQTGFGKAAWHMPRHWRTWMSSTVFQKQGWLNALPTDSQKMYKVELEVKAQLPKVMGEEDNTALVAALQSLTKKTQSMASCVGGDSGAISRQQRVSRVSSWSIECRLRILWQWSTMQNLALVLANTERIMTTNIEKLENVRKLRETIAEARSLIARLQQKTSTDITKADSRKLDSTLSWPNTTDFAEQYRVHYTYRNAQKQYMHLTWLDLIYASLDGLLSTKEHHISHILHSIHEHDLIETLASVKHGISTSPLQNARNGIIDILPYRTTLFLETLRHNTSTPDEHALRRASCQWMQTHAPPQQKCTCGDTVGVPAWRVRWASRDQVREWTKQHLRHLFWNELDEAEIWHASRFEPTKPSPINFLNRGSAGDDDGKRKAHYSNTKPTSKRLFTFHHRLQRCHGLGN
ncbi:hypothetical protein AC578_6505 [Pseudocercospora eumusae]|uniref:Uncharacterized protein n=1 Tax=Pseudocercospora eumusae TaxID=321146 RepID=A0A139HHT5_9PEZI|nr:hypothetical protein AC578_6505 [Pseudocercospora eumusae]